MSDVIVSAPAAVTSEDHSYVDWPAIIAGTVVASAISLVLLSFGSALGLSMTSAYEGSGISAAGFAIAAALWLVWVEVSGFFAGGYLTGRMRRRNYDATEEESDIRDGSHGLAAPAGVLSRSRGRASRRLFVRSQLLRRRRFGRVHRAEKRPADLA